MLRLGGQVLGFAGARRRLRQQGRDRWPTRMPTVVQLRGRRGGHAPPEGGRRAASPPAAAAVPVINAGDGGHMPPDADARRTWRRIQPALGPPGTNLTVGLCGEYRRLPGRTVHSLIKSLSRLPGMRFVLVSPEELRVPDYIISEILEPNGIEYVETRSLEEALPQLDILYMTRVQRERFFNEEDYIRLKNSYVLTKTKLDLAPADMAVLHPLPRVNENHAGCG